MDIVFLLFVLIGAITVAATFVVSRRVLSSKAGFFIITAAASEQFMGWILLTAAILAGLVYNSSTYSVLLAAEAAVLFALVLWRRPPAIVEPNNPGLESFTVMSVNVLYTNEYAHKIVEEVAEVSPDVLVVLEFAGTAQRAMKDLGPLFTSSFIVDNDNGITPGVAVFSKRELVNTNAVFTKGRPIVLVDYPLSDGDTVTIAGVHTASPVNPVRIETWDAELETLTNIARSHSEKPFIAAGDFNATVGHASFREMLTKGGLIDITSRLKTWTRFPWLPNFLHLDHIVVNSEIAAVTRPIVGKGYGSDHSPVVGTFTLR